MNVTESELDKYTKDPYTYVFAICIVLILLVICCIHCCCAAFSCLRKIVFTVILLFALSGLVSGMSVKFKWFVH